MLKSVNWIIGVLGFIGLVVAILLVVGLTPKQHEFATVKQLIQLQKNIDVLVSDDVNQRFHDIANMDYVTRADYNRIKDATLDTVARHNAILKDNDNLRRQLEQMQNKVNVIVECLKIQCSKAIIETRIIVNP